MRFHPGRSLNESSCNIPRTWIVLILCGHLRAQSAAATFKAEMDRMIKENPEEFRKPEAEFASRTQIGLPAGLPHPARNTTAASECIAYFRMIGSP